MSFIENCGDGGSRTLVQTRNPQAFYMLIPLLVFEPRKGANALNATLSPKFRPAVGAPTELSRNCLAPRAQAGIRNLHLRDVSSPHLVRGLSQWSTVLRSGSESVVILANYFFAVKINERHCEARHAYMTIHLAVKTIHPLFCQLIVVS